MTGGQSAGMVTELEEAIRAMRIYTSKVIWITQGWNRKMIIGICLVDHNQLNQLGKSAEQSLLKTPDIHSRSGQVSREP
jgi:hypothetical protein